MKVLNINYSSEVNEDFPSYLEKCINLEELSVVFELDESIIKSLIKLPKLRKLKCNNITEEAFTLLQHSPFHLKELHIQQFYETSNPGFDYLESCHISNTSVDSLKAFSGKSLIFSL